MSARWHRDGSFTIGGEVSATPTVAGNAVYASDWAGNLYAIDGKTGKLIWSHRISEYNGVPASIARNSPAVHGNEVIIGDIQNENAVHAAANVIAVDRRTGVLRWITQVDSHRPQLSRARRWWSAMWFIRACLQTKNSSQ
jgi:polyvinyl alcohol dehydrogenase (cytochrome)